MLQEKTAIVLYPSPSLHAQVSELTKSEERARQDAKQNDALKDCLKAALDERNNLRHLLQVQWHFLLLPCVTIAQRNAVKLSYLPHLRSRKATRKENI